MFRSFARPKSRRRSARRLTSNVSAEIERLESRELLTLSSLTSPTEFSTDTYQESDDSSSTTTISPELFEDQVFAPVAPPESFTVVNTNDAGFGSLRWAIDQANLTPGRNAILFDIPDDATNRKIDVDSHLVGGDEAADVFVIELQSALPWLTDTSGGTWISGHSQALSKGNTNPFGPEIVLDGSRISDPRAWGFTAWIHADGNRIEGLNIQGFSGEGIAIVRSNSNIVSGNYIGTDPTGTEPRPNARSGVMISAGAAFNQIGSNGDGVNDFAERNVISGNETGVRIQRGAFTDETRNNVIRGNYIGTDAFGRVTEGLGNRYTGFQFVSSGDGPGVYDNLIAQNIIDGNPTGDFLHVGVVATENTFEDNLDQKLTATFADGVLTVMGSDAADHILVTQEGGVVVVHEVVLDRTLARVAIDELDHLFIDVGAGNDWVDVDHETVLLPTTVHGGDGNDHILGGGGRDLIFGGAGDDSISGRTGNDVLYGESGHDVISGGDGNDEIYAGRGNDLLTGGDGDDTLSGQTGDDWIAGGFGDDFILGGQGNDVIFETSGLNRIDGGPGNDQIQGGSDRDIIHGSDGDDIIAGGAGPDIIYGDSGFDTLDGQAGVDSIRGGYGDDLISGGSDRDYLFGDAGVDYLDGGPGADFLWGGANTDLLLGGPGNDFLNGQGGEDYLDGQAGEDDEVQGDDTAPDSGIGSIQQASFFGSIGDFFGEIGGFFSDVFGSAASAIAHVANDVWDVIDGPINNIGQFLNRISDRLITIIEKIPARTETFLNQWTKVFTWEGKWWRNLLDPIIAAVNAAEIFGLDEALETVMDILPGTRSMTQDEIQTARTVYGTDIDYSRVLINEGFRIGDFGIHGSLITKAIKKDALVLFYTINLDAELTDELLIHELMHVWQHEHDKTEYVIGDVSYVYGGIARLESERNRGVTLFVFNREQQGEIMKDYFIKRNNYLTLLQQYEALSPGDPLRPYYEQQLKDDQSTLELYAYFVKYASSLTFSELSNPLP